MAIEPGAVRGVLAGAYRGKNVEDRTLLTHYVRGQNIRSVCGLSDERLVDVCGAQPEGEEPRCPRCAARWKKDKEGTK